MKLSGTSIIIAVLLLVGLAFSGFAEPQKTMSVQVKEGQVRSTPSFLGKIVAKPIYGDRVSLLEDGGQWLKVALRGGVQGWMHASSLTSKTIVLKAGAQNVQTSATGGEIALAGKGFSEEVEKRYRSQNRALDYRWVDRMELSEVSPEEMASFLKQGNVVPAKGGAR